MQRITTHPHKMFGSGVGAFLRYGAGSFPMALPEIFDTPALAVYTIGGRLCQGDVARLHTLVALGSLVGDLRALVERLEPAARYPAVVNEEVFAAFVGGNKAVAFIVVE